MKARARDERADRGKAREFDKVREEDGCRPKCFLASRGREERGVVVDDP